MADVLPFPAQLRGPLTVHEADPCHPIPAPPGSNGIVVKLNGVAIAWAWAAPIVDPAVLQDHAFGFVESMAEIMRAEGSSASPASVDV